MKTQKEFTARREELKAQFETYKAEYDRLRKAWSMSGYNDDAIYRQLDEVSNLYRAAQFDLEYYTLLTCGKTIYANQAFYTDHEPWEVIEIRTDRLLVVRKMKATIREDAAKKLQDSFVPGGFFGHTNNDLQEWDITPDPDGEVQLIRRHKNGVFHIAGNSTRFYVEAEPYKYYDYNF